MVNDSLEMMTFEEAMKELENLVDSLDKGDVSLDEAIAAYDKGSRLKDHCQKKLNEAKMKVETCLLYTSPSPRDLSTSRMPSSA